MSHTSKIEILRNLRPETVVALEGIDFMSRVEALPGVEQGCWSITETAYAGGNTDEDDDLIDVEAVMRLEPDSQERMVVMEKFIVAGGLIYDQDSERCNPLKNSDGEGGIFCRGRRASGDEESSFYEAIGLDGNGDRDYAATAVCSELGQLVWDAVRGDRSLRAKLQHMLKRHGVDRTIEEAVRWAASYGGDEDDVACGFTGAYAMYRLFDEDQERLQPLCALMESNRDAAWERAREAGTIGHPLAVLLDIYEHSGVVYSVAGSGMQCRWDTSSCGAVWVPDDSAEENIRYLALKKLGIGQVEWRGAAGSQDDPLYAQYSLDGGNTWAGHFRTWHQAIEAMVEASGRVINQADLKRLMHDEARQYCESVLKEYNDWVNGEVFGVVVYVIDRATGERIDDQDDECWGYIGNSYAEETLEDAILNKVLQLGATIH